MDVELKVPNSLEDITVGQYQEFIKVNEQSNDEEFIAQKMVSIFCDIPMQKVLSIQYSSLVDLSNHFTTIFKEETPLKTTFKFNGIEFGFVPSLETISLGEYIDLEESLKSWDSYHKALSVLYRPISSKIGSKYTIKDYEADESFQDLMRSIPVSVAIGATLFFYRLGNELSSLTLDYSLKAMKTMNGQTSHLEEHLRLNGVGINQYMLSLKETLLSLKMSADSMYTNVLPTLPLNQKKTK